MTGFRATRLGPVGPRRRRRGLDARPDDLRQGDGRRLPGRGVRRPRRRDGACSSPEGPVYQAGTLSGNPVATTAGLATLRLATDEVYAHLDRGRRHDQGRRRRGAHRGRRPARRAGRRHHVLGLLHRRRPVRDFADAAAQDTAAYAAFFHAMLDRGVYLPPSAFEAWFLSAAHDDRAVQTVLDALPARRPRGRRGREPCPRDDR